VRGLVTFFFARKWPEIFERLAFPKINVF